MNVIRHAKRIAIGAAAASLLAGAAPVLAQTADTGVEPDAAAALDRMGAYLRSLKQFQVTSDSTIDIVVADNQKLQTGMRTTYLVDAPSRMRVSIETDRRERQVYYDGKSLTFAFPETRKYLAVPAAGTIGEVLDNAAERYGIEFPLQDLFRWGDPSQDTVPPVTGFKVGDVRLNGEMVEHYAYRQAEGVDFQVWLTKEQALPRKLVITDATSPAQPQMTAHFTWDFKPKTTAKAFAFDSAGWQKVDLAALRGE